MENEKGTANAHPIQRSFFIKYYGIAFAILPGLAGGLARELLKIKFNYLTKEKKQ
jgi:hypothetical protein